MKIILSMVCLMLFSVASLAGEPNALLTADKLLDDCIRQLPAMPLTVAGSLLVRRRRGIPIARYKFELKANWGAYPARAQYTISDAFGRSLEQFTIIHGATNSYKYAVGSPLHPAKLTSLSATIQTTDLSWMDITLAFLWWRGGKIIGEESKLTIDCYVIQVPAPTGSNSPYKSVKLWISKKSHMMLQAEGFDADGKIIRRLWVRSAKKIEGEWMIKNMEVQKYPAVHRTKLRVISVKKETPAVVQPSTEKKIIQGKGSIRQI